MNKKIYASVSHAHFELAIYSESPIHKTFSKPDNIRQELHFIQTRSDWMLYR